MNVAKNLVKTVFFISVFLCVAVFVTVLLLDLTISKNYRINKGDTFSIKSRFPISADFSPPESVNASAPSDNESYSVSLKLFGLIPFSTVNVEVVDKTYVCVLGQPFGMRVYTDGVLVIDTAEITTKEGKKNPAAEAGIAVGDYIVSVDGQKIACNEELYDIVQSSEGKTMTFRITRNGKTLTKKVRPVKDAREGEYRVGIWIRDSSAGIGTLTFYSPSTGVVCGLGHGLGDSDTGELLKIDSGQMVSAEILSVQKGKKGAPGELSGSFTNEIIADIVLNTDNGVYGNAVEDIPAVNLTQISMNQEIEEGPAQILCTVEGDSPRLYSCTVKRHSDRLFGGRQNLQITVTDKDLLSATGGIVQGMSGSPVLQNGKLIGAVTHVLLDDPATGYAAFAEDMLKTAETAAKAELKEAS